MRTKIEVVTSSWNKIFFKKTGDAGAEIAAETRRRDAVAADWVDPSSSFIFFLLFLLFSPFYSPSIMLLSPIFLLFLKIYLATLFSLFYLPSILRRRTFLYYFLSLSLSLSLFLSSDAASSSFCFLRLVLEQNIELFDGDVLRKFLLFVVPSFCLFVFFTGFLRSPLVLGCVIVSTRSVLGVDGFLSFIFFFLGGSAAGKSFEKWPPTKPIIIKRDRISTVAPPPPPNDEICSIFFPEKQRPLTGISFCFQDQTHQKKVEPRILT